MLAGFIGAAFVAGAIGSWATFENVQTWYPTLNKPSWQPPSWIFGPMWTTLYVLMGIAAWRAWRVRSALSNATTQLYFVHLVFNALWSVLFFGLKNPEWALVDIAVLWVLIVWLLARFIKIDRIAVMLWLPYLAWVTFAACLNLAIVRLN
jgi:benzodiazapine receptor